jgi:uncharacterized coiled-coil protein SlyX
VTTELWIALLTFLSGAAGVVRWLISVYWSQAKTIEDLRATNEKTVIKKIEDAVTSLRFDLDKHRTELLRVTTKLQDISIRVDKTSSDGEALIKSLSDYIDVTVQRIEKMESRMIELSKNLVMIKGGGKSGG